MQAVHEAWMRQALACAEKAAQANEVPVGAVVVLDDHLIGQGANAPIGRCDPTAHAEVIALREAAKKIGNYRLNSASLYVTLEPCLMCYGAMIHARIAHVYFGAFDPKFGVSQYDAVHQHPGFNHRITMQGGIMHDPCAALLQTFFKAKR